MITTAALSAWSIGIPAFFGLLIYSLKCSQYLSELLFVLCGFLLFGTSIMMALIAPSGFSEPWKLLDFVEGISIGFSVERLGVCFALLASGLFLVTTFYAIGYMRANQEKNLARFYACFCFSLSFVMGICYAENLLTLFIFYELLTLITYPLVTHKGNDEARHGGRIYLGLLISTSIGFLLIAILWTWHLAGNLSFSSGGIFGGDITASTTVLLYTLFVIGTGKAGLFPFHRWLPSAMVAPTPVSALLHAVAVVKAGVFVVIKVSIYIFGIDFIRSMDASYIVSILSVITMIGASLVALRKDSLKARLAYSTIGQLAYIVLGTSLATANSIAGAVMHMITHGVGKITLFFCAGAIYTAAHKTLVSELGGLAKQMPFTFTAFGLASLSIIGLPPFAGAWSKWFLLEGALDTANWLAAAAYLLSTLLAIGYLAPILLKGLFDERAPASSAPAINEGPLLCVGALCITAVLTLILFFLMPYIYAYFTTIPL